MNVEVGPIHPVCQCLLNDRLKIGGLPDGNCAASDQVHPIPGVKPRTIPSFFMRSTLMPGTSACHYAIGVIHDGVAVGDGNALFFFLGPVLIIREFEIQAFFRQSTF